MPRTTITLDGSVLSQLRRRAELEKKSMGQLASELLARELANGEAPDGQPFAWIARDLGSPHIDLENKNMLYSVLDTDS